MKTSKFVFYVGISTFLFCLGILIGVSSSPVAGVFITGILGLLAGIAGFWYSKQNYDKDAPIKLDFTFLGLTLFLSSIFLVLGVYLGSCYRINYYNIKSVEFIWSKKNKPINLAEALDWIRINEILTEKGYSKSQIQYLYSLKDSSEYDEFPPYYKMLIENNEPIKPSREPVPIDVLREVKRLKIR